MYHNYIKSYFNKWLLSHIADILYIAFYLIIIIFLLSLINGAYLLTYPLPKIDAGVPLRIKIPSLNIDTLIEKVGITPDGYMDVPKAPENVAWLNIGPTPGEIGSSVIDGHSGYKDNKPAVFDDLYKLKNGDEIEIEDNKGTLNFFTVRDMENYGENAYPSNIFSSNDGKAHLNLITCSGLWDKKNKTHSLRLIVFTDKI